MLAQRLLPFGCAAVLGLLLVLVPGQEYRRGLLLVAVGLTVLVGLLVVLAPWRRLPLGFRVVPALAYLIAVGCLRHSLGGTASGVSPLVLLPVVWIALYGSRRDLVVILAGIAAFYAAPMLAFGSPAYPSTGWRLGALQVVIACIIGSTVQGLIRQVREQAEEARAGERERARLLAQVRELAHSDALTGVANRRGWDEILERQLARDDRGPATGSPCLVLIDLDGFKSLNDAEGHAAGDRALQDIAASWEAELRPRDFLARLGGDEFGMLLEDCDIGTAERVVARLREATSCGLGCSAGIARWDGEETAEALQFRADQMLYAAKRAGRNRTRIAGLELVS